MEKAGDWVFPAWIPDLYGVAFDEGLGAAWRCCRRLCSCGGRWCSLGGGGCRGGGGGFFAGGGGGLVRFRFSFGRVQCAFDVDVKGDLRFGRLGGVFRSLSRVRHGAQRMWTRRRANRRSRVLGFDTARSSIRPCPRLACCLLSWRLSRSDDSGTDSQNMVMQWRVPGIGFKQAFMR